MPKHHATIGYVPEQNRASRKTVKQLQKRSVLSIAERTREEAEHERVLRAAEQENQSQIEFLPARGEKRPGGARTLMKFKLPKHETSTPSFAGAYPFLAEAGLGTEGVYIGPDVFSGASFVYDPFVLYNKGFITNPNILLAGVIGTGKSSIAKSLAVRSIASGKRVYVPGDVKGEWTPVAEAVGGKSIVLGQGSSARLNPLDAGARPAGKTDQEYEQLVWARRRELLGTLTETLLARRIEPTEHTALDAALRHAMTVAAKAGRVPILPDVVDALFKPVKTATATAAELSKFGLDLAHALTRMVTGDLAGLFDDESTVTFESNLPMLVIDLSQIAGNEELLSLVMTCSAAWMEASLLDPDGGRRLIIYDEAWRIMRYPALIRRMQSWWKLSRAFGISNMIVMHRLSDLDAVGDIGSESRQLALGLLADCSTRIIYRQEHDQLEATGKALAFTQAELELLPKLEKGTGVWKIGERTFCVYHRMTVLEEQLFDTTQRMVDQPTGEADG